MSRGRKERTPAQLAFLAQARERAKIAIAKRAKLNALAKKGVAPQEPEPVAVLDKLLLNPNPYLKVKMKNLACLPQSIDTSTASDTSK